ncbi:hypothetical protein Salat_2730100 [Sesamum alatum]|uniref:Uncharacterized protein n=1 Tax=Sesamum alatum TaxID=300844 RepID=A0AAE1XKM5_9LAMI|nr:hypothetical protein Salat_2730100 [Sesamum alatum]
MDFLKDSGGGWNSDLVSLLFQPDDAALITSIPVGNSATPDTQIWHFNKQGSYHGSLPRLDPKWLTPAPDTIKINFDALIQWDRKGAGVGIIARDSYRQCVMWRTNFYPGVEKVEHGIGC